LPGLDKISASDENGRIFPDLAIRRRHVAFKPVVVSNPNFFDEGISAPFPLYGVDEFQAGRWATVRGRVSSCQFELDGESDGYGFMQIESGGLAMAYRDILRRFWLAALLVIITGAVQAQTFSVTYNFGSATNDPYNPSYSGIIAQGRDGNLYSTSGHGGSDASGALFQITPGGTLKNIYSFTGNNNDAAFPFGGVTLGSDGNFYGASYEGGSVFAGAVFMVTTGGTEKTMYSFTGGSDGAAPYAPPVEGNDGNFYGTTTQEGTCGSCGTIYKITPQGKFTLLHQFDNTHGSSAFAPLVLGTDGNFYGTAAYGTSANAGVIYRMTPSGVFTMLYSFDNTHGETPIGGLTEGSDGNFYGTTMNGGSTGGGVVFKVTRGGKLTVLHNMNGTSDGRSPIGGLVLASDGNFYGTNAFGGIVNSSCADGCGTLFKITPKGAYSVLYKFDSTTGAMASVTPFQHTSGVLYGDTKVGGTGNVNPCTTGNCGVFYSLNGNLPAFVSLLSYSGKVGKTIEFLGQGFTSKTTVSFNGTAAKPKIASGTYLTATVPNGAITGPVTVTTGSVKLTSNKIFLVTPQITNFSPTSGPVGTQVKITGIALTGAKKVTFGGVLASQFTVDSYTQVTATVPTGALSGHIAITTPGGVAVSSGTFTVTQ
jgi:uncharacterized repeat protein (TIGR03803 family)